MSVIQAGSLLLYKGRPARAAQVGERLTIVLPNGESRRVRPKDVLLLHPGPFADWRELEPPSEGEVAAAWELLAGQEVSFADLAELIYGEFTPRTAWATWQLLAEGVYFEGQPPQVRVCTPEEVARRQAAREEAAARERACRDFLERARRDEVHPEEDAAFLREIADVALKVRARSSLMRDLGLRETPEQAHALLLRWGVWSLRENPYPRRLGIAVTVPQLDLPPLPDEDRCDLTHLPAFAIDDEGNQDPDDALSLEGDRIWVHVADVAALVPPDSPADREARARTATVYLPEVTIPMLPDEARARLGLGLQPVSPALSVGIDLDAEGVVRHVEVVPSWVRVTRLTYAEADARMDEEPFGALEQRLQRFAARRQAAGAVEIHLPEVRVRVVDGEIDIRPVLPLRSRRMVREGMLLAGAAVAHLAQQHGIPMPFTTQDAPDLPEDLPPGLAGMFALRRRMQRRQYRSTLAPHAALGLPGYVQATSPLRRYLDLVTHQQLRAWLRGEMLLDHAAVLERVGMVEAMSGTVRQVEALSRRHWLLVYLLENLDWEGEGVLVERSGHWGRFLLPDLGLTVRVYLAEEMPLNTVCRLAVQEVDLPALEARFQLVG